MKVVVSHDVDHLRVSEHALDLIVPKHIVRSLLETASGAVESRALWHRAVELARNRWEHIDELAAFDRAKGIPSTWFVAVARGRGLRYGATAARRCIDRLRALGFDVGLHAIATHDPRAMAAERDAFAAMAGEPPLGARVHSLGLPVDTRFEKSHRYFQSTLGLWRDLGYAFTSNVWGTEPPIDAGGLWEFPIQAMDVHLFNRGGLQRRGIDDAKKDTVRLLEEARERGLPYFGVLLHDRYYSASFPAFRSWYEWLVDHIRQRGYQFTSYRQILEEKHREADVAGE